MLLTWGAGGSGFGGDNWDSASLRPAGLTTTKRMPWTLLQHTDGRSTQRRSVSVRASDNFPTAGHLGAVATLCAP